MQESPPEIKEGFEGYRTSEVKKEAATTEELLQSLLKYSMHTGSVGPSQDLLKKIPQIRAKAYLDDNSTSAWVDALDQEGKDKLREWLKQELDRPFGKKELRRERGPQACEHHDYENPNASFVLGVTANERAALAAKFAAKKPTKRK